MRYREGQDPTQIKADPLIQRVSDFTVAYTLIVAFIFIAMGKYGKQRWLIFWGVMTIFAVITYVIIRWFDLLQV